MHSLYDHTYIPNNADVDMMDDDWKLQTHGLAGLSVPKDLQPLLHNKDIEIHLYAQLKCDGIIHSTYVTHEGNSQIFFYLDGNRKLAPIAGLQHIYSKGTKLNALLAVKCAVPVDKSIIDPSPSTCIVMHNSTIHPWTGSVPFWVMVLQLRAHGHSFTQ